MRWHNTAWVLLQHIDFIEEQNKIALRTEAKFKRERISIFSKKGELTIEKDKKPSTH